MHDEPASISFGEALRVWSIIGLNSFGGPAGQIAVMHRILVEERRWVSEGQFLHALNYCMLLPGPEAMQLVTYVGWLLHGYRGGIAAGTLFVMPGFIAVLGLSLLYTSVGDVGAVQGMLFGLKAAVLAVVLQALIKIGRRVLKNPAMLAIAGTAFAAIFFLDMPFPLIVAAAALTGLFGGRWRPAQFAVVEQRAVDEPATASTRRGQTAGIGRAVVVAGVWLAFWLVPIAVLAALLGADSVYVQEGLFFSKAAVVTFGGAYAVLAYIAQQAVEFYGWLQPGEMLDGLGMAETTPGPLIQVVQFVGYMAAYRDPGALPPWAAGVWGSIVTTWVTFVPCFLWIFVGAPYIERLRDHVTLRAALSAITAAVVGVILNLAIWFGVHVAFADVTEKAFGPVRLLWPDGSTVQPVALLLVTLAAYALFRVRVGIVTVVLAGAAAGALYRLAVG